MKSDKEERVREIGIDLDPIFSASHYITYNLSTSTLRYTSIKTLTLLMFPTNTQILACYQSEELTLLSIFTSPPSGNRTYNLRVYTLTLVRLLYNGHKALNTIISYNIT